MSKLQPNAAIQMESNLSEKREWMVAFMLNLLDGYSIMHIKTKRQYSKNATGGYLITIWFGDSL